MRFIFLILFLFTSLCAQQTPSEWWNGEYNAKGKLVRAGADSSQKAFAKKCYEFGKQYGRGHTLAAIAWMESSLGKDINHDEDSSGPFGISNQIRKTYRGKDPRTLVDQQILMGEIELFLQRSVFCLNRMRFSRSRYSRTISAILEDLGIAQENPISGHIPAITPERTGEDSSDGE